MSGLLARWADLAARLLDPDERAAVRGDHAELSVPAGRALREVIGLVVRRQAALWTDWRPWIALVAVVVPIGILLSHASRAWADASAIYVFLYANNWTWAFLEIPGARLDLLEHGGRFLLHCITLIGWSWSSGYVLGSLSRRTLWVTGTLFCLLVVLGTAGSITTARSNVFNDSVFSSTFYGAVFPRMLRAVAVLIPAIWGMRRALLGRPLPPLRTTLWAAAIVVLTTLTAESLEGSLIFGRNIIPADAGPDGVTGTADDPRFLPLLPLVMVWPVAYMLASASWHRWRERVVSA